LKTTDFFEPLQELHDCRICPRNCGPDRYSRKLGYCNSDASFSISAISIHKGEEPVISGEKGICNIFFGHCNLQCIYCQNYQISNKKSTIYSYKNDIDKILQAIFAILDQGVHAVGFVSPSHVLPQMKVIISLIKASGRQPVIVYNSNGYDKIEELKKLEGLVDIYLPDFKYRDSNLAKKYSDVSDYPEVALKAIKEMYRQKGSSLIINANGTAESGLIIRHLVLPGNISNSMDVLKCIADEISSNVHISLMSQYYPTVHVNGDPDLSERLTPLEYRKVVEKMEMLGLFKGWIQNMGSAEDFRPDFKKKRPFE
jgi:putative pyruvate formate lyase activating enzyme